MKKGQVASHLEFPFEAHAPATNEHKRLLAKFPILFRAARFPTIYVCNLGFWGIQCGPGWYHLIERAAEKIEAEFKEISIRISASMHLIWVERNIFNGNPNNQPSIQKLMNLADPLLPFCTEISSKDGCLQMYMSTDNMCDEDDRERISNIISHEVDQSKITCERCGRPGSLRPLYFYGVYCNDCIKGV